MIRRRALLAGIAAAGGTPAAIAALAAMAPTPATGTALGPPALPHRTTRVVVLGAGIAGLAAAHELRRAGWPVQVLEAAPRPGGRCLTLRAGDTVQEADGTTQRVGWDSAPHLYFNPGPARIPHHHRAILGLCRSLGVALEPLVNENRAASVQSAGNAPVPLRRIQADLRGVVAELAAKALSGPALDAPVTTLELEALRAMLRRFGALDADLRYRGSSRAGWAEPPGAGPAAPRPLPPLDTRLLLDPAFWLTASITEGIDYAATMLAPVGGMDRIAAALHAVLGDTVTCGATTLSLRRTEAGARVIWQDATGATHATEADRVLITLPATVLARLDTDLSPERRAGLAALAYSPSAKLGFHSARRFWEDDHAIYGGIAWTTADATQLWYPSHDFHGRGGILVGAYLWGDAAQRFAAATPAARAAGIAADGERLHPGYTREVAHPISLPWSNMPHARGAWAEWTEAQRRDLYPLLRSPEGPYHFAGEHLSWLPGWQEGAVLSAWSALEGLARSA